LYWYRTPPDVKVGREPFDPAVRAALEANNPGVRFDWRQILETPIPSADAEKWRERRRAERSERAARQSLDQDEEATAAAAVAEAPKHVIEAATAGPDIVASVNTSAPEPIAETPPPITAQPATALNRSAEAPSALSRRKRRRRRGGRGRTNPGATPGTVDAPADASSPPDTSTPDAAGDEHATDTDE
jgi:hypothetical protein